MTAEQRRRGSLRTLLVLAFLAVAAVAIAAFAGLTLWVGRGNVDQLVRRQQTATAANVAGAAADGYRAGTGWSRANLRAAHLVALSGGAVVEVTDASGAVVATLGRGAGMGMGMGEGMMSPGSGVIDAAYGAPLTLPVVVDGTTVGSVAVRFPKSTLPPAEQQLRDALTRTTLYGILIAAAAALLVGLVVADGITRPLRKLTGSVRQLGAGDRRARADVTAPGEIGELAAAFDAMADRLEREDSLRRTLTADVAHELRTPVTILTAQCEAMIDGVTPPSVEQLASLHDEALRLARVIEDLETLAAAEAAGLRLELEPVDLADVAAETVASLRAQFAAADVALNSDLATAVVTGDRFRLGQVVRNLLVNALKYTPAGGRAEVSVAAEGDTATVGVTDTGVGIPPDEMPHVFDRFWRGEGGRGASGSGVGLAVVSHLVEAHGGMIEVVGRPGGGTVFTVRLPRASEPADLPASEPSAATRRP